MSIEIKYKIELKRVAFISLVAMPNLRYVLNTEIEVMCPWISLSLPSFSSSLFFKYFQILSQQILFYLQILKAIYYKKVDFENI